MAAASTGTSVARDRLAAASGHRGGAQQRAVQGRQGGVVDRLGRRLRDRLHDGSDRARIGVRRQRPGLGRRRRRRGRGLRPREGGGSSHASRLPGRTEPLTTETPRLGRLGLMRRRVVAPAGELEGSPATRQSTLIPSGRLTQTEQSVQKKLARGRSARPIGEAGSALGRMSPRLPSASPPRPPSPPAEPPARVRPPSPVCSPACWSVSPSGVCSSGATIAAGRLPARGAEHEERDAGGDDEEDHDGDDDVFHGAGPTHAGAGVKRARAWVAQSEYPDREDPPWRTSFKASGSRSSSPPRASSRSSSPSRGRRRERGRHARADLARRRRGPGVQPPRQGRHVPRRPHRGGRQRVRLRRARPAGRRRQPGHPADGRRRRRVRTRLLRGRPSRSA